MKKPPIEALPSSWDLHIRKLNNVAPDWYIKNCGTFCSQCRLAYDFYASYRSLQDCRAKGQLRGPRCIRCGKILRTRSKPNPKSGFWNKVEEIDGERHTPEVDESE